MKGASTFNQKSEFLSGPSNFDTQSNGSYMVRVGDQSDTSSVMMRVNNAAFDGMSSSEESVMIRVGTTNRDNKFDDFESQGSYMARLDGNSDSKGGTFVEQDSKSDLKFKEVDDEHKSITSIGKKSHANNNKKIMDANSDLGSSGMDMRKGSVHSEVWG
jgi:hypothetical protein